MFPVVLPNSSAVDSSSLTSRDSDLSRDSLDFFLKDGRKISIGDCALFKPPKESPPFIGIIRRLTPEGEGNLSLGVNWLYRQSDLKLGKGALLDAAPNEIFYSFHEDVIPAGSLLHPCNVAFLHKGADLPSGLLSFVCRRVYDTENKCLWWLTDKDYVNERQEEVDKLLKKTLEMHGVVQSGGRSPKPLNGPTSTSQIKSSSEGVQNSGSLSSQGKSKKRERSDQATDPSKRERLQKADRGDCGQARNDHILKSEIAKITDRGGLVDFGGVEKLVQLMQPDDTGKRIDVAGRIILADVISVTDRFECLSWFVQLKGLSILDGWLQEVHTKKITDGTNAKENEKNDVEFLLALLRALGKLPVNLHALQNCNVGKSVNHLRNHKNGEISKKAKSLVETWKKRVGAEMNMNDMKSGQARPVGCPSKPASSEGSLVENKRSAPTTSEAGMRNSAVQSSVAKSSQVKGGTSEGFGKLSASSSSLKSAVPSAICTSNNHNQRVSVALASDLPLTPIKEERSSSSSLSQNNSQSCSGDQGKTAGNSYKEDARSSTTGSVSKSCSCASRQQKSSNGVHTPSISGATKESVSAKGLPSTRNSSSDKSSPTGISQERLTDVPVYEHGNNQRLIVRLPTTGRSPSRGPNISSCDEDASVTSIKTPVVKHEPNDKRTKPRCESQSRVDVPISKCSDNCQDRDGIASDDMNVGVGDENQKVGEDKKPMDVSKVIGSLLAMTPRQGKPYDPFLSSMNALVESCVKISEASASTSPDDDGGMNLLASVAAGEMIKSENVSSSTSPQRQSNLPEDSTSVNDENKVPVGCDEAKEESGSTINPSIINFSSTKLSVPCSRTEDSSSLASPSKNDCYVESENANSLGSGWVDNSSAEAKVRLRIAVPKDDTKTDDFSEKPAGSVNVAGSEPASCAEKSTSCSAPEMDSLEQCNSEIGSAAPSKVDDLPSHASPGPIDHLDRRCAEADQSNVLQTKLPLDTRIEADDGVPREAHHTTYASNICVGSSGIDNVNFCTEQKARMDETTGPLSQFHLSSGLVAEREASPCSRIKLDRDESDGTSEFHVSDEQPAVCASMSGSNVKLDFDLNEGFPADEGSLEEPLRLVTFGTPSLHGACPLPVHLPPISSSFPNSVTVAAAAKGSFVPPENPLRGKGELGWKGSAATSAFRPAEPRRSVEMPVGSCEASVPETNRPSRRLLDFDLNVADERIMDDVPAMPSVTGSCSQSGSRDRVSSGLDLDLNRAEESPDVITFSANNPARLELPSVLGRSSLPGGVSNSAQNSSRDFDLNNGPGLDDVATDVGSRSQPSKSSLPFPSPAAPIRIHGTEFGNFSWFPPTNSYSAITVPSIVPGRGEHSYISTGAQRILAPPSASTSFGLEMYRGNVLPSSPAVPFPSVSPFPYSGFPFDTSFAPSTSAFAGASAVYGDSTTGGGALCFPTMPSQLVGPSGVVTTPYSRPFIMSLPGVTGTVGSDMRKWGGPIDLNSGPGVNDAERRDDRIPSAGRPHPTSGSQSLTDEQLKAYQLAGGMAAGSVFKRKEPDGGWDSTDRFSYKQASWQ